MCADLFKWVRSAHFFFFDQTKLLHVSVNKDKDVTLYYIGFVRKIDVTRYRGWLVVGFDKFQGALKILDF
jgi:hypothetical protein